MVKRFFKGLLIFILGMIFGLVALFGGLYIVATQVKVGDLTGALGVEDAVGDELKELNLIETVVKLSDTNTTVGKYFEYFPTLEDSFNDLVNDGEIGKFVNIELDELKNCTMSNIGGKIGSVVSVVVSLNSLKETFNFELPTTMPIFCDSSNGGVLDYIKITSDSSKEVTNSFYKDKTDKIYYKVGNDYLPAYENGNLISSSTAPLYFKGYLVEVPITDAITGLSGVLDMQNITFKDLKDKLGVDIRGEETSLVAKIIKETDTLNGVSTAIEGNLNSLTLADIGIDITEEDGVISKIITGSTYIGSLRSAEGYEPLDFEEKINGISLSEFITVGDTGIVSSLLRNEQNEVYTIGELADLDFEEKIDTLVLGEMGINIPTDGFISEIINSDMTVAELKAIDFGAKINALTVEDLGITLSGVALKVLSLTDTIGALTGADGYEKIDINQKIDNITLEDMGINIPENDFISEIIDNSMSIKDLKEIDYTAKINALSVEDLGIDFGTGLASKVLYDSDTIGGLTGATGYVKIDINSRINDLTVEDLGIDFGTGIASKVLYDTDTIGSLVGATGYVKADINERINNLTVEDMGIDLGSGLASKVIATTDTIKTLSATIINKRINDLTVEDLGITLDGVAANVLKADDTIGGLTGADGYTSISLGNRINNLTIDKLLDGYVEGDNMLLDALVNKGATVGNMSDVVKELTLTDVYGHSEVFIDNADHTAASSHNYMEFDKVTTANGHYFVQVGTGQGEYYIKPNVSVWLILLYDRTGDWGSYRYTYSNMKLLDFGEDIGSGLMSELSNCTMQELYEMGILDEDHKPANETVAKLTLYKVIETLNSAH